MKNVTPTLWGRQFGPFRSTSEKCRSSELIFFPKTHSWESIMLVPTEMPDFKSFWIYYTGMFILFRIFKRVHRYVYTYTWLRTHTLFSMKPGTQEVLLSKYFQISLLQACGRISLPLTPLTCDQSFGFSQWSMSIPEEAFLTPLRPKQSR